MSAADRTSVRERLAQGPGRGLGCAALECGVLAARWSLWLVVGGVRLTARQRSLAVDALFGALGSESDLERVAAMQALADTSVADAALRLRVRAVLERALEDESAARRARARRLFRGVG